jgi:4-aminobutyrate aminotransferase-like enzyme
MDAAWPVSEGEAIHTSTFLGHPVGCAMALAQIEEIKRLDLVERAARLGDFLLRALQFEVSDSRFQIDARGVGLLAGVEITLVDGQPATSITLQAIKMMLKKGFILLPEGEHANVIGFTPPLTISEEQLRKSVSNLAKTLSSLGSGRLLA